MSRRLMSPPLRRYYGITFKACPICDEELRKDRPPHKAFALHLRMCKKREWARLSFTHKTGEMW